MNQRFIQLSFYFLLVPATIFLVIFFLFNQFWNDEAYTLLHFTLQPYSTILNDYHVPNNHIFFNLLHKSYLQLLPGDMISTISHEWLTRLPMLLLFPFTCLFIFQAAKKIFSQETAAWIMLVFFSSQALFETVLQVRGYGLSLFLFSLIWWLGSFRYSWKTGIAMVLASAMIIYTMPSNIYFVGQWIVFEILFRPGSGRKLTQIIFSPRIITICAGIILGLLAYYPVFDPVFLNPDPNLKATYNKRYFAFPVVVTLEFVASRWLLILFNLLPFLWLQFSRDHREKRLSWVLVIVYLCPFLFNMILGGADIDRVFFLNILLFAILSGWLLERLSKIVPLKPAFSFLILSIYMISSLAWAFWQLPAQNAKNNRECYRRQAICNNYFSAHFFPRDLVRQLQVEINNNPLPVLNNISDLHETRLYLDLHQIPYTGFEKADSMATAANPFYMIAACNNDFNAWNLRFKNRLRFELLSSPGKIHRLYRVSGN